VIRKIFDLLSPAILLMAAGCSSLGEPDASTSRNAGRDIPATLQKVEELCASESGAQVSKTIKDVPGFVFLPDATYRDGSFSEVKDQTMGGCSVICLEYLFRGYSYVEAPYHHDDGEPAAGIFELAQERGLFRYEIKPRSEADCSRHDYLVSLSDARRRLPPASIVDRHPNEMAGRCLVASKVDKFESAYGYQMYWIERKVATPAREETVHQKGHRVVELETDKTIAIGTDFIFYYRDEASNRQQASCTSYGLLELEEILVPPGH